MIEKQAVERQVKSIYQLVQIQRALRLFLKSAWIILLLYSGLTLAIIAAGQHQLEKYLFGLGLLLIILQPMLYFFSKRELANFVWLLDRRLELKEQVSAAWQSLHKEDNRPFVVLLFEDVSRLLTSVYQNIRIKGWYVQKDLLLVLILGIVAFCVSMYSSLSIESVLPSDQSIAALPPLQEEPSFEDVFPKGMLSYYENEEVDENNDNGNNKDQQKAQQLKAALEEAGAVFSKDAFTQNFGEALQNAQMEQAAQMLEMLANNAGLLSNEMKTQMGEYLQEAKKPFEKIGEEQIVKDLDEATKALSQEAQNSNGSQEVKDKLNELAKDLRDMAPSLEKAQSSDTVQKSEPKAGSGKLIASGTGSETAEVKVSVQQELSEAVDRLSGEGNEVVFGDQEKGNEENKNIFNPNAKPPKENVADASVLSPLSVVRQGDQVIIRNNITPNYFSWTWRDEIAKYFEREY